MQTLVDGQNLVWPDLLVRAELTATRQCDLSLLVLGSDGRARDSDDFVFYNQPSGPAARWSAGPPQRVEVDLSALLAGHASGAVLLLSVDPDQPALTAGEVTIGLAGSAGPVATYTPAARAGERAIVACELYRRAETWKVRAFGQGYLDGLARLLTDYGVEVDEPADSPAATPADPADTPPRRPGQQPYDTASPGEAVSQPAVGAPQPTPAPANSLPVIQPPPADTASRQAQEAIDRQRGFARQTAQILEDLAHTSASVASSCSYAEHALTRDLDKITADPANRVGPAGDRLRAEAQARHDDLVSRARQAHERDLAQLGAEIVEWNLQAPAPMVSWDSPQWQRPAQEQALAMAIGQIATDVSPHLSVPLLVGTAVPGTLWVDTEHGRESATQVLTAMVTRLVACFPPGQLQLHRIGDDSLFSPLGAPGCQVQPGPTASTPEQIKGLLSTLAHEHDLRLMAAQAGVEPEQPAPDQLLVITDFSMIPDVDCLELLLRLTVHHEALGMRFIVAGSESDELSIAAVPQVFDDCQRVPCVPTPSAFTASDPVDWVLTPDTGPRDAHAWQQVLTRLSRG